MQMICTVIALIPKDSSSWRPIALLHMVYRWWAKMLRPQLVSWESQHSGPWDAASKGMGAEAGSFEEEATTELHLLNG